MMYSLRARNLLPFTTSLLLAIFALAAWASTPPEDAARGLVRIKAKQEDNSIREIDLYHRSHALVIGVSEYTGGWPSLPGVAKDVAAVRDALAGNGFAVTTIMDPDAQQLINAFEHFIAAYGNGPGNRLLFYFSGHGHTVQPAYGGEPIGYIVPKDAPDPGKDPEQFKRMAMSMQRIEEYARTIDAKHALFLFDSCFSGSLFALSRAIPQDISYKTARPVRQFITSGGEDEQVPDKSIFRQQFLAALRGEADANGDGYVTGTELGNYLQTSVINYTKGYQHPQYGKMRDPNLDKGDFVFALAGKGAGETAGAETAADLPGQFRKQAAMTATETDQLVQDLAGRFRKNDIRTPEKEDDWTRNRNTTMAFLDIEGEGASAGERHYILDTVSDALRASGRYTLVEREILDKLIAELRLSRTDLADPATALKLGRILSAGLIATGSMNNQNQEWLISLRFIDTETTSIRASVSTLSKSTDKQQIAADLSGRIMEKLNRLSPLQGRIVFLAGDTATVNIGSAVGVRKNMALQVIDEQGVPLGEVRVKSTSPDQSIILAGDRSTVLKEGMRVREPADE
ncbi:MAG TPA: hypothetical protein DDY20_05520 [Desulfobulbaceae bacterium]|nr:hypothetical protein [Desulfobulbaceae bacterium]